MAYYYPLPDSVITEYVARGSAGEYRSLTHFSDLVADWLSEHATGTYTWTGNWAETRGDVTIYFVSIRIFDEHMATLFLLRWS